MYVLYFKPLNSIWLKGIKSLLSFKKKKTTQDVLLWEKGNLIQHLKRFDTKYFVVVEVGIPACCIKRIWVCAHMRMWSLEVDTECLFLSLSTDVFTKDLSLNLELTEWVAELLSKPLGSPCLCPPALLWQPHNHTWPFTWELGAEVRFSFCAPSTWPYHESSLQPLKKTFVSDIFSEFSFLFF